MTASLFPHLSVNDFICIFCRRSFTNYRELIRVLSQSSRPVMLKGTNLSEVNIDSPEHSVSNVIVGEYK